MVPIAVQRPFQIVVLLGLILCSVFAPSIPASAQGITCDPATPQAAAEPKASPEAALEVVPFPEDGGKLDVFAAASLTDAFARIGDDIEASHPGITVSVQTGASQALVTQLDEGAQADILATANLSTMADAESRDLVVTPSTEFIANRLVIVAPNDNPSDITGIESLTDPDTSVVVAAEDVPAGRYSREAVCAWAATQDDPESAVQAVNANIVSEEADVRGVLAKVQTGEADAGIVYASDATASGLAGTPLTVVEFPDDVPTRAAYAIAPVTGGAEELANAFISYVLGPDGQDVLVEFGFTGN